MDLPKAELNTRIRRRLVEFLVFNSIYLKKSVPPDAEKVVGPDITLSPPLQFFGHFQVLGEKIKKMISRIYENFLIPPFVILALKSITKSKYNNKKH